MKKNILTKPLATLKSKGMMILAGGFLMTSCTIQTGGYSETDGVYYDPQRDTLPQATDNRYGNRVGDYYEYEDSAYERSQQYGRYGSGRYKNWDDAVSSDWGAYAGSETNYDTWGSYGWGFPYSYYRPFGWGSYFGMGFGWGSPWMSYSFSPFWYDGFYSPWYSGFYGFSPYYYGGLYNGFYNPYYGLGYGTRIQRRSSGPDGFTNGSVRTAERTGYRNTAPNRVNQNQTYDRPVRRMQSDQPVLRQQNPDIIRNNGGFRSGGMDAGSMRSGGFNTGGVRSSGGFRTGGR